MTGGSFSPEDILHAAKIFDASRTADRQLPFPLRNTNGTVTFSAPGHSSELFTADFGTRLIVWPTESLMWRRTSILSSRLGKRKDLKPWWFDALRTAVLRLDVHQECLCAVDRTAPAEAVRRCSELFGIRCLNLRLPPDDEVLADPLLWLRRVGNVVSEASETDLEFTVYVSPPLAAETVGALESGPIVARRDRILAYMADRIVALSVRAKGQIESLLQRTLTETQTPVLVTALPEHAPAPQNLIEFGAVPWILSRDEVHREATETRHRSVQTRHGLPDGPIDCPEEWLCHWTRPTFGAWPQQEPAEFWDELILGCDTADRSAFAALLRIVQQQSVLASANSGGRRTVSLTEVPLAEFRNRRIFRRHKQRFDFEPYGVAIRRQVVRALGGRPVEYVENEQSTGTSDEAEFRQPATNRDGTICWTEEREWRIPQDVDLSAIAHSDVVFFVENESEIHRLTDITDRTCRIVPPAASRK